MNYKLFTPLIILLFAAAACAGDSIFPAIGANMSNPITLSVDSTNGRMYVNNSNYRVSYGEGSLHAVNITDPTHPTRINYATTMSFSGEFYLDTANQRLYTPNRNSDNESDTADNLYRFDINEASANFLARTDFAASDDPYGIACCDSENRMLVASAQGRLDYYDLDASLSHGYLDMTSSLSTGVTLSGEGATRVRMRDAQAIVTRSGGGVWIVALGKLGVSGEYPIDYIISDINNPQGIATDGTDDSYIYVVDTEVVDNVERYYLYVLDISSLTPRVGNTTTEVIDKNDSGLVVAEIDLVTKSPREVVLAGSYAYVTHFDDDIVSVVDLSTYTMTAEISVGDEPFGMAVYSPGGTPTHLCVANSSAAANSVSIVDIGTRQIVGTYP